MKRLLSAFPFALLLLLALATPARAQVTEAWVARHAGPGNADDRATAFPVDGAGNVHVTGRSNHTTIWFDFDYLTVKYDPTGDELWAARYNGPGNDWDQARGLALDDDGNVYVTGTAALDLGTAFHDYATIKYDAAGVQQWVRFFDGVGNN